MKGLLVDALRKIVPYKIGDPKYLSIKHSEALKRIRNKHKISRFGPKITRHLKPRKNVIEYCIVREGVPFGLKSIGNIIIEEKEELLSLIYEEVEEDKLNLILKSK